MNKYIKSPMNYVGGKYKLLPQILPLFPNDINTFIDLFCGGFNVGINVNANRIIGNDINLSVIKLLEMFQNYNGEELILNINKIIDKYGLSKTNIYGYEYYNSNSSDGVARYNKDKYKKMKDDYNNNQDDIILFYTVVIFAFNNQIRFNKEGKYNMPVNKRDFNNNIQKNVLNFCNKLSEDKYYFINKDFTELKVEKINKSDFVYLDPPYLISCASYNENDGWNDNKDSELLKLCDKLNENKIRFAMSNVLEHKGLKNDKLIEWSKKYKVYHLNYNYNNCNYQDGNKKNKTDEVLIVNY